ncbi:MAG: glycosyltransferase [Bacteroidetes bacterium]|nr:glycosyltransferase [Bacteroidota bacterium]
MKILHIIPTLSKGGAERLVIDIVKQLNKQEKIQARLVIFRDEIKYHTSEIKEFISIIPSSVQLSLMKKWQINVTGLQAYINNFEPDVIHTHLFEAEFVSRFCHYPKARWFSHVHDNMVQLKNWSWSISKTNITNWYEKKVLFQRYKKNGGTHFIAISKHTESYIKSVQSNYPVTLLHNAIDVKRFQKPADFQKSSTDSGSSPVENQPSIPIAIGTTLNPDSYRDNPQTQTLVSTLNLINIGSFVPKKNQTLLLDIILELKERGVHANCVFLGDGPLKTEVQNKVKELGISNQCQFLGNVENVEEHLWQSDVYVHTATYEPLGLVLLEAMSAGLPIITLDGGGNRDLMINGKNGFLIEKQNPYEFANRILEVFQNKEILDFNTEFAKQSDIESYSNKVLSLYTD